MQASRALGFEQVDAGKLMTLGQIAVGRDLDKGEPFPLRFPSKTTWLRIPALQFPEILTAKEGSREAGDYANLSCTDLAMVDEQGLSINHAIAAVAAALRMKMLVLGDLQYHCAHVSLDAGT